MLLTSGLNAPVDLPPQATPKSRAQRRAQTRKDKHLNKALASQTKKQAADWQRRVWRKLMWAMMPEDERERRARRLPLGSRIKLATTIPPPEIVVPGDEQSRPQPTTRRSKGGVVLPA